MLFFFIELMNLRRFVMNSIGAFAIAGTVLEYNRANSALKTLDNALQYNSREHVVLNDYLTKEPVFSTSNEDKALEDMLAQTRIAVKDLRYNTMRQLIAGYCAETKNTNKMLLQNEYQSLPAKEKPVCLSVEQEIIKVLNNTYAFLCVDVGSFNNEELIEFATAVAQRSVVSRLDPEISQEAHVYDALKQAGVSWKARHKIAFTAVGTLAEKEYQFKQQGRCLNALDEKMLFDSKKALLSIFREER